MTVNVVPHLNFRGNARPALEFYSSVFGGHLTVVTYADIGAPAAEAEAQQVVWGQVSASNGFQIMAYDVPASRPWSQGEDPFFVSVRSSDGDIETVTTTWGRLAEGATISAQLEASPWAVLYGMLTDKFGVTWVFDVVAPHSA